MEKLLWHSSIFTPPHQKNFLAEVLLEKRQALYQSNCSLNQKMLAALLMLTYIEQTSKRIVF